MMRRLTKSAFLVLTAVIICSIFVSKVTNLISGNPRITERASPIPIPGELFGQKSSRLVDDFGTGPDNLMTFVQVSDIHVSIFSDPNRLTEFEDLLRHTVSNIAPAVVIASGDLTDARGSGLLSVQHLAEWQIYYDIITRSGILERTTWLDIRGNHDTFNVENFSTADFFKNYSVQGYRHERSYSHQLDANGDRYTFIAVDASLEPGPKRPFNFIGELLQPEIDNIRALLAQSREFHSNYLIWFGHYPTSCILSPNADTDIRTLIGGEAQSLAYLCGHLHTFGGMVPKMYSLQQSGYLELELGDWKMNRIFRLAAVDHGLFSFVDLKYNQFPIILITNPKSHATYIPGREDLTASLRSSHVRILAYSSAPITECRLRFNEEDTFQICTLSSTAKSLYVAPWTPQDYSDGSHTIEVTVTDAEGRTETVVQPFSFDGSRTGGNFSLLARLMLSSSFTVIFVAMFAVAYSICVVPLLAFRLWHVVTVRRRLKRPHIEWNCVGRFTRRMWLLSSVNRLFYPLVGFYLYILVGPWTVGEVIDGHLGWVFLWGIFVKGRFMPGTLTYLYGFFQLMLCQFPLILIYASMVDYKYRQEFTGAGVAKAKRTRFQRFWPHIPFTMIIAVEVILAVFYFVAYGTVSFVMGPLRTWSVVLHVILFHQALTLQPESLRSGMKVWFSEDKRVTED